MTKSFNSYAEFIYYLNRLGVFHINLGLGRMQKALDVLKLTKLDFPLIHIVGTNGKGSTAAFLQSLAVAHGLRAGLYTSPHFICPRERIRISGQMLSEQEWLELANTIIGLNLELTYFELLTVMSVLAFKKNNVDLVIMEAGLGGTYDATTIFKPSISVLTRVDLDHEQVLGPGLLKIARDKAGAIRESAPAICAPQAANVVRVFKDMAKDVGSQLYWASDFCFVQDKFFVFSEGVNQFGMDNCQLGLSGSFQAENACLALSTWSLLSKQQGIKWHEDAIRKGFKQAWHPGRFQIVPGTPSFILDGAHNVSALKALNSALQAQNISPQALIFSCMQDKNLKDILPLVIGLSPGSIFVPQIKNNPRAMEASELAGQLKSLDNKKRIMAVSDMSQAINLASKQAAKILICGSLYLLGDFFSLNPQLLSPN